MTKPLYQTTIEELKEWSTNNGLEQYRANQVYEHLYLQRKPLSSITTLPNSVLEELKNEFIEVLEVETFLESQDDTFKWLYRLQDGNFIETVLMIYEDRATVCISSQAGCAMGCTFCATGQAGFDRHLSVAEIVEQVARACFQTDKRVSNVVFMGMGEPLANIENVYRACEILCNDFNFSARNITISTVGFIPGMKTMQNWKLPITLAVSLHTPFNDVRDEIVPINKRYPIEAVLEAAKDYSHVHNRRVSFEYTAIAETNIDESHAQALGKLLADFKGAGGAHLNIIPLNATKDFSGVKADRNSIQKFADNVRSYGVTVTIRKNRGNDIDAACGQLRERITS